MLFLSPSYILYADLLPPPNSLAYIFVFLNVPLEPLAPIFTVSTCSEHMERLDPHVLDTQQVSHMHQPITQLRRGVLYRRHRQHTHRLLPLVALVYSYF